MNKDILTNLLIYKPIHKLFLKIYKAMALQQPDHFNILNFKNCSDQ